MFASEAGLHASLDACECACVRACPKAPDSGDVVGGWAVTHPVYPFFFLFLIFFPPFCCCYLTGFDARFDW